MMGSAARARRRAKARMFGMLRDDDVPAVSQDPIESGEDQAIHDAISRALDESLKQGTPVSVATSP